MSAYRSSSPKKSPSKRQARPSTATTTNKIVTVTLKTTRDYETQNHLTVVEVENEHLRTRLIGLEEQSVVVASLQ